MDDSKLEMSRLSIYFQALSERITLPMRSASNLFHKRARKPSLSILVLSLSSKTVDVLS